MNHPFKIVNKIVFSGGGMRGCAHIGVVKFLEEKSLMTQFDFFAGTSIGSLIATLLVIKYSSVELTEIVKQFDYERYQSFNINNLLTNFGVDTFEKMSQLIASMFLKKNLPPYISFIELFHITKKHLIINAVCLNTHTNIFFDHILSPRMPIIIALQASMSLPFIFGSVEYNGLRYVDGGLLNNFPIDFPLFAESPETVLGINLGGIYDCSVKEINTIDQYCINLFSCLYNAYIKLSHNINPLLHVISIITPQCTTFDFLLDIDGKQNLINLGYNKISLYYDKINTVTPPNNTSSQQPNTLTTQPEPQTDNTNTNTNT